MTSLAILLLRVLPAVLLCLTLTGAADAAAPAESVVGWGYNNYGQATPPDTVTGPVTDVAAGYWHSCEKAGTGNAVCWSNYIHGRAAASDTVTGRVSDIAAGSRHSCAIQAGTGKVVCWGGNFYGKAIPPNAVNGVSGTATDISAGGEHSCAIQAGTGRVVCWGDWNTFGQATPPYAVNGASGTATDIAAGGLHSCAIQAFTGNVICWGNNASGQATPPDAVNGVSGTATDIAAGQEYSCAIQAGTGNVVCWGNNYSYGHPPQYQGQATPPDAVNGVSGTATAMAAGGWHGCAIQAHTGNVICWGSDMHGRATPPDAVNGVLGTATAIAAGAWHSCAIQAGTGKVVCWGYNGDGQSTSPDEVNGVSGTATAIAAGSRHNLAILAPVHLTNRQRACVNAMNRSGEKVNRTQLRENELCLRDFQAERLVAPMTFDGCMTADRRGRMQRAGARTAMWERMTCDSLDVPPPFAYIDSATVNTAAVDGALALTYKIFGGPPVLDADLVTMADSKETARCQFEMLERADQLENTVLKEINRAKRRALRDETVDSEAAFEAKLQAVLSSNGKINKAQDRLVKRVDNKCADLQAPPDAIFSGECSEGNSSLSEVEACVIAAARCVACLKINAFDNLNLDCDQADDQDANGSCPLAFDDSVDFGLMTNADCFPASVPDSAPNIAKLCVALANAASDMLFTPADYERLPEECKSIVLPECH